MKRKGRLSLLKIGATLIAITLIAACLPVSAWSRGLKSLTDTTSCKTKYPIIIAHGMGFEPCATYPNSFPGIVEALEAKGATVYTPTVDALGSTREKAEQFKEEFLKIMAISGASKFNVMAHSHGCLYTRDAITNLGLAPYVVSHTSTAGVHRGTETAQLLVTIEEVAPELNDMLAGLLPFMGDQDKLAINIYQLTPDYMNDVFNPNTPNVEGIYYQSWSGQYRYYSLIKSTLDFIEMFKEMANSDDTSEMTMEESVILLYESLPSLATQIFYLGGGYNDGLVPVESAKWGTYLGTQSGPWWSVGVNHLDEVNMAPNGSAFDAVSYWVKVVQGLKSKGF